MTSETPEISLEPKPDYMNIISYAVLISPLPLIKYNTTIYALAQSTALIIFMAIQNKEYEKEMREWNKGKIKRITSVLQYTKGMKTKNIKIPTGETLKFEGVEYGNEKIVYLSAPSTQNSGKILIDYDPEKVKIEHNLPCPVTLDEGVLRIKCDDDVIISKSLGYVDDQPVFTEEDFDELKETAKEGVFLEAAVTDNQLKVLPPGRVRIILPGPELTPKDYFSFFKDEFELDTPFGLGTYNVQIGDKTYTVNLIYEEVKIQSDEVRTGGGKSASKKHKKKRLSILRRKNTRDDSDDNTGRGR